MRRDIINSEDPLFDEIHFNDPADFPAQSDTIVFTYSPKSGNIHNASLSLPDPLKSNEVMIEFVRFFYSRDFKKLGLQTKSQWFTYLKRFFGFLESLTQPISINLGQLFLTYLKRQPLKEHGLYDTMRCTRWAFIKARENLEATSTPSIKNFSSEKYKTLVGICEAWPTLRVPPRRPRKSMREKTYDDAKDPTFKDGDFLHSLRFTLLHYLNEMQKIRSTLHLNHPELIQTSEDFLKSNEASEKIRPQDSEILSKVYYLLIEAAYEMEDSLLIDLLFFDQVVNRRKHQNILDCDALSYDKILDKESKAKILRACFSDNKMIYHYPSVSFFGARGQVPVANFSTKVEDIFTPSLAEHAAFAMLLASDRIQPSNQSKMTSRNFIFDSSRLEISSFKKRTGKTDRIFYPRTKLQFSVYQNFIKSKIDYKTNLFGTDYDSALREPIFSKNISYTPILSTKSVRPINLICIKNSVWNHHLNKLAGQEPRLVDSFVEYWSTIVRDNSVKPGSSYLSLDGIARSRINFIEEIEPESKPSPLGFNNNKETKDDRTLHDMTGLHHSARTHYEIYRRRSKISLQKQDRFAALVGDEMHKSAIKLESLVRETSEQMIPLTPEAARKRLGLDITLIASESDSDKIKELIEHEKVKDYVDGIFNEIKIGEKSIILITPLVSELIRQYITHIDNQIENVAANSIERANRCAIRALTLNEILSRFPKKIVSQGRKLYGHFHFPFPDLMVTIQ